jgi:hypothetical protein
MGNRFSKPVALNRASKTDQLIMKHIEGKNFSGYVKGLILEDIAKQANKGVIIQVKKGQKRIIKEE